MGRNDRGWNDKGNAPLTGSIATPAGYTVSDSRSGVALKAAANQRSAGPERNAISFNLASGITWSYQLTFAPTAAQAYPGNVAITSNDSDEPTLNIALTGSGYVPPTISILDSDLYATLAIGATANDGFAIDNLGSLPLTFSITETPAAPWFSLDAVSGSVPGGGSVPLTGTFSSAGLAPGEYQTTLVIACNDPLSPEAQVNVNLVVTNRAPTIALPVDGFEFDMNTTLTIDFSPYIEDLDGHPVTLAATPGSFIDAAIDGLSVTFSAPADWFGSETLDFSVYDGYDYGYGSAEVSVLFVNRPPVIALPEGFEFDLNGSLTVDFGPYISDPDPQSLTLGYSGNSNIQVAIESAQVTFTALAGWHGSEEVTFSVYDGYAYSYDTATVTVNFVNQAPTIALPVDGFEFAMNGVLIIDFEPYIEDLDGHPVTLVVGETSFINAAIDGFVVTFTAPADWFGSETLDFSVYDGYDYGYGSAEVSVLLTSLDIPAVSIAKTAGGIDVWWPAVTNANRYQILRSFDPYGTYEHLAYADQPAYTDLGDFDRAFYRVKALYEAPAK